MDKALLVGFDLGKGAEIVSILDEAGLLVAVALWAFFPEEGDPRLVLASRRFDQDSPLKRYGEVLEALRQHGVATHERSPLMVLKMDDPLIQGLRKVFSKAKSVAGMRLAGQSFGDRFIEEAYVYRIA